MVYSSLKRVNRIEGEKFTRTDWSVCTGFGLMFALPIVFGINLGVQAVGKLGKTLKTTLHISLPAIPPMSEYVSLILFIELLVLLIYPIWEMLYLARSTSDAVTGYHKWLESTFVDRVGGRVCIRCLPRVIFFNLYNSCNSTLSSLESIVYANVVPVDSHHPPVFLKLLRSLRTSASDYPNPSHELGIWEGFEKICAFSDHWN